MLAFNGLGLEVPSLDGRSSGTSRLLRSSACKSDSLSATTAHLKHAARYVLPTSQSSCVSGWHLDVAWCACTTRFQLRRGSPTVSHEIIYLTLLHFAAAKTDNNPDSPSKAVSARTTLFHLPLQPDTPAQLSTTAEFPPRQAGRPHLPPPRSRYLAIWVRGQKRDDDCRDTHVLSPKSVSLTLFLGGGGGGGVQVQCTS